MSNLINKLGRLGEAAGNAGNSAQQAAGKVSKFDRQAQKTEKSLANWAKEKYQILLEAKERLSPVLSTVKNGLKSFAGKTWSVTMKAIDLVTSPVRGIINLLKNPVFQAGAVLGVSIGMKDTIDTYKNFEAAMSQVKAVSGAEGADFEKLTNKAKEMGATTKFTAAESAEAFNYMAMAGWKTEDMLGGIEGILNLAAASGESLAVTSDIVTDALTAFGMKADEAGHFSDVLAAASSNSNTNVSLMGETFKYAGAMAGTLKYRIEDVALATGLMANAGIKGNMAGTALNSIFTRLSTNANGAADALAELGIAFFNSDGSARPLLDVIKELRDATAEFTDEQKANLGNTVAGTYAQKGFLAILNATAEDYDKLYEAVNSADGAAARMSEIMLDNLQGSITLLQSAVDGVKISFGERLSPYIRNLADWLTAQMPAVEQGLNEFMDWLDARIDRVKRKFNEIADTKEWQDADFFGKVRIAWDEFIAEPFRDWWNGTGKAEFAGFAQDIGTGIGTGLKAGIMTLLGIDLEETLDEGVSIGASFAEGFAKGFDFSEVSGRLLQVFKGLTASAFELLPGGEKAGFSSVISAVLLSRIAKPIFGIGRGAVGIGKGLFGAGPATGTSLMGSFLGSAASGTGLLGKSAMLAINTGAGNLAGGASLSAGALSAIGLAEGAGAVAGAAGLIHGGMDLYTGFTAEDEEKAAAYKKAGTVEVGGTLAGAGAGAAAGAAIGAVFGGVSAVPGALIGAGIGAVGSWIAGNKIKEEYQEKYQENLEKMQKEAERAQKVFEAAGLSIEDVTFKNEALVQAMNDSEVSASQFALMFQEECADIARKAFGDISLSLVEVKKIAEGITFAGMAEELNEFTRAAAGTEAALNSLESSVSGLKKENWKVSLGMELSETDKDSYKSAIENFLSTSQAFIDDNHYQATVALKLLTGGEADTTGSDSYYGGLKSRIEDLGTQLTDSMNVALEDSIITLDEAAELESLQEQISAITNKLTEAKTDAEMQALKIKYNGAALDMDSFNALQEELQANVASASEQYESALTLTLTNLNLQLADGAITQAQYDEAVAEATEGYYVQINEINARVSSFNLESIASAFEEGLDGFMPEMEGTLAEKLQAALNTAVLVHPDVGTWHPEDVAKWIGLDKLNLDTPEQLTIAAELKQIMLAVPEGTKQQMIQNFKDGMPSKDELLAGIGWNSLTEREMAVMMNTLIPGFYSDLSAMAPDKLFSEWGNFDILKDIFSEKIAAALEECTDTGTAKAWLDRYYMDFDKAMAQYGPISNEYYEQMAAEWQEAGSAYGDALNSGVSESLLSGASLYRSELQTALDSATANPFAVTPTVNVTPYYNIAASSFPSAGKGAGRHAAGGYVSGGPQLSWLAEEGYGEFVIPTNPSRRAGALALYEQAGAALGVSAHAAGGYAGGSVLGDMAGSYTFFNHINKNDSSAFNETTGSNYGGETAEVYETVPESVDSTAVGPQIQVRVDMSPEFVIHGGDGQSEEGIMQVIRRHMKEMADELGGRIAENLTEVYSNMPLKEA